MALNISSILKEESYLKLVKDAYRGSHYIENLTEKIGDDAWDIFKQLASFNEFISSEKIIFIISLSRYLSVMPVLVRDGCITFILALLFSFQLL